MMTTELTQQQIDRIFEFTSKKYIKYHDVQLELVDHVASRIEEMMTEDPALQFETALQRVYKSFGVYGFTKVQREQEAQLQAFWNKKLVNHLKTYITIPKILLTTCLIILNSMILAQTGMKGIIGLLVIAVSIHIPSVWRRRKARKNRPKLLIEESITTAGYINAICISIMPQIFNMVIQLELGGVHTLNIYASVIAGLMITFIFISLHIINQDLPKILDMEISKKYGHLQLR